MSKLSIACTFGLLTLMLSLPAASAGANVLGRWQGTIDVPARPLDFTLEVVQPPGQSPSARLWVPALGVVRAGLVDIALSENQFSASLGAVLSAPPPFGSAKLTLARSADGSAAGNFTQGGHTASIRARWMGNATPDAIAPSAPFPPEWLGSWRGNYEAALGSREMTVTFSNKNGRPHAEWLVVGRNRTNVPPTSVTFREGFLVLEANDYGLRFEARLNAASDTLVGSIEHPPVERELRLARVSGEKK